MMHAAACARTKLRFPARQCAENLKPLQNPNSVIRYAETYVGQVA